MKPSVNDLQTIEKLNQARRDLKKEPAKIIIGQAPVLDQLASEKFKGMGANVINFSTSAHTQLVDITDRIQKMVTESECRDGLCHIWVPHTTAGLTVNENADPAVVSDIISHLDKMVPWDEKYKHGEGNSAAHIKSSLMGCQLTIAIKEGRLQLGTWQGIYFCEFDGPRQRQVWLNIL